MSDLSGVTPNTCRNCGKRIVFINWATGAGWTHQPKGASFQDGMHRYCRRTVAEPSPLPPLPACPLCGSSLGGFPASPTIAGEPTYICASCKRVSTREEWSR